jgi:RNA polymerase sigma-70 factor (ECF subfamily)
LVDEEALLALARQGNHDAFQNLTEPYRHELLVYGYRLLGSLQDAEDLIQETLLRAWTRLTSFAGRSSFRAWLYKIATNTGLNMLAYAPRRALPTGAATTADQRWLEPLLDINIADVSSAPDAVYSLYESVSLAFMIALHRLPPAQRAILILCDVLDWRAAEVAEFLDKSVPAVNSGLQRARATLAADYHPIGLDAITVPSLTPEQQTLLNRYMRAWESSDVAALAALLKEDASFSMPPQPLSFASREAISRFFAASVFVNAPGEWRLTPLAANAQPAFALYQLNQASAAFVYFGLMVITLDGEAISTMTAFLDPLLGARYGLA